MERKEPAFTISEFGSRARITVRTLRFYEELGLLIPTRRNSSGHKLYGLEELAKLQQIQSLKFLGYSLQEIKELLVDESNAFSTLEQSLPLQHKLLVEKRDELNRAIDAVEQVQFIINEGKPVTWTVLSSLLFQMENEQDQIEWMREYFSDDIVTQFFALPKEQRQQIDMDMLDWLTMVKQAMQDGVSPDSPEAFELLMKLMSMMTEHIDDTEELAEQLEKAQESMDQDEMEFKFPTFFTREEEAYIEEIGKAMEAAYNEQEQ